jgi:hypothetical protein
MSVTFVGLLQILIGTTLLFRPVPAMLVFLIMSGLFGGSAAVTVSALGNSSIPPIQFALVFAYLRILMPHGGHFQSWTLGIRDNFLLVLFTLYGMVAAIAGPRIFAGQMNVAPLRFDDARNLFDTVALAPTPQNFTAAIYLLGALLTALAAYAVVRARGGLEALVKGGVVVAWIHAVSGLAASLTKGTGVEAFFDLFRNGSYAQLDQAYQGFNRIDGFFPETSGWAAFGLAWFIFNIECWHRSVWSKQTGRAALVLGTVLFFSTSSTAYVGLACYGAFFLGRMLVVPGVTRPERLREVMLAAFGMVFVVALAMVLRPAFADQVVDMLLRMTVEKQDSQSGQQRLFWAMQGFEAFRISGGLGIGPGSFRSSSLVTAIIGTMGVIGIGTFVGYLVSLARPLPASADKPDAAITAVMAACVVAALFVLVPAAIASPNSHPGTNFSIFAGAALGLRGLALSFAAPRRRPLPHRVFPLAVDKAES